MHNKQKKIALINDFTGFGRCSIAVELPIISALKVQCCPLPTSILSNHTGFESFFMTDYTSNMNSYIDEWKKLDLKFSGISTGFLGSADQIEIVKSFIKEFKTENTVVVIDPVMGDHGKVYKTYTEDMCERMKELVRYADITTPNITEACILTDTPYHENWKVKDILKLAEKVSDMGPDKVVITGVPQKSFVCNACFERGKEAVIRKTHRIGTERNGTGDVFSAIISADAVNKVPFSESVKRASNFIKRCIEKTIELGIPNTDGVAFEELLHTLK